MAGHHSPPAAGGTQRGAVMRNEAAVKKEHFEDYPHSVRELCAEILRLRELAEDQKASAEYWEAEHMRLMKVPGVRALWLAVWKLPVAFWPELPNGEGVAADERRPPAGWEVGAPGDGSFLLVEGGETPEQEAARHGIMDKILGTGLTESEVLQGPDPRD